METERETWICACLSSTPTRDLAHNPDLYPDQELNLQPFSWWGNTQLTVPLQPAQGCLSSLFTQENTETHRAYHFRVIKTMVNNLRFKARLHGPRSEESNHWLFFWASGRALRLNKHQFILRPPGASSSPAAASKCQTTHHKNEN